MLIPRFVKCLAAAAWLAPLFAQQPTYQNPGAPFEKRVDDLLGRLTLEEKVSQLMNDSAAIARLGVPQYNWWGECLHGVARAGRATVFPEPIGLAATWDTNLLFRVSTAISDEARAKHHEFVRRGQRNIYQGLTFWSPTSISFATRAGDAAWKPTAKILTSPAAWRSSSSGACRETTPST